MRTKADTLAGFKMDSDALFRVGGGIVVLHQLQSDAVRVLEIDILPPHKRSIGGDVHDRYEIDAFDKDRISFSRV